MPDDGFQLWRVARLSSSWRRSISLLCHCHTASQPLCLLCLRLNSLPSTHAVFWHSYVGAHSAFNGDEDSWWYSEFSCHIMCHFVGDVANSRYMNCCFFVENVFFQFLEHLVLVVCSVCCKMRCSERWLYILERFRHQMHITLNLLELCRMSNTVKCVVDWRIESRSQRHSCDCTGVSLQMIWLNNERAQKTQRLLQSCRRYFMQYVFCLVCHFPYLLPFLQL